jgi:rare lipoprotein A
VYKLQLGPIEDEALAHELLEQLKQNGYPQAYKIKQTL